MDHPSLLASSVLLTPVYYLHSLGTISKCNTVKNPPLSKFFHYQYSLMPVLEPNESFLVCFLSMIIICNSLLFLLLTDMLTVMMGARSLIGMRLL